MNYQFWVWVTKLVTQKEIPLDIIRTITPRSQLSVYVQEFYEKVKQISLQILQFFTLYSKKNQSPARLFLIN